MPYTDPWKRSRPAPFHPDDLVVSSASADGVRTLLAVADRVHLIKRIYWSYSATPSAGNGRITITDAAALVWQMGITAGGPGYWDFMDDPVMSAAVNTEMVITIKGAGASNVGTMVVRREDIIP